MTKETEISEAEIKKLQGNIKLYERNLQRAPNNPQPHYMKGKDLFELGKKLPNNPEYFKESLKSYNKAIELNPTNGLYYTKRGELHANMGNTELAAEDIKMANTLPSNDDIANIYMQNTRKNIAKLTSVQEAINKLKAEGQINSVLAEAFLEHTKVTEGLVVSVGVHGEKLDIHDGRLGKLESMLAEVTQSFLKSDQERKSLEVKLTEQLKKETAEIKGVLSKQSEKMGEIDAMVEDLAVTSSAEFVELSKKISNLAVKENLFDGRLKIIEGELEHHHKQFVTIDETLKQANIYQEQEIKAGFEGLKKAAPDAILYRYANSFHWALSNYLLAYRAIGSGMVEGVREQGKFEEVWGKVGGVAMNAFGIVPGAGSILQIVESGISLLNDTYQGVKFDRKVEKINSLITHSVLEKDLSLAIAGSAIQIALSRQDEIIRHEKAKEKSLNDAQSSNKIIDKMKMRFDKKMDKLLTKVAKVSKTELTPAEEMAVKDVIRFINYIATHDDAIHVTGHGQGLDKAIAEIMCNYALKPWQTQNQNQNQKSKDCIVCTAKEFIYDNPLLNMNNEALLKLALKHYGSKTIDMSFNLSQDLMEEINNNQDLELLIGGLMSLE